MAADRTNRGRDDQRRQAAPQDAASTTPGQGTGRAARASRTGEREQRIETVRETGPTRERGAFAEHERLARRGLELFNARDFDEAARLVAEDVECLIVPFAATYEGRDGYRRFMQMWANAFPDGRVEIRRVIAGEDGAAVEYVGRGTHTGPLAAPGGSIPATGKRAELVLCDVLEIEQGQVRRIRSYFDGASLMRQLGIAGDAGHTDAGAAGR